MRALRISDAFDQPAIAPERLEQIIDILSRSDADTIRSRAGCKPFSAYYDVKLYDQKYWNPVTLTEDELSAAQEYFRTAPLPQAAKICEKLEEAERRIDEAKDYAAEIRGRTNDAPGRKLV